MGIPGPIRAAITSFTVNGHLQLNLFDEKLKFTSTSQENWDKKENAHVRYMSPMDQMLLKGVSGASAEIVIDGPAGEATIREKGKVTVGPAGLDGDFCMHVKVPKGLLPPGSMLKMDVDRELPMVQGNLNHMPHTVDENGDVTYDNDAQNSYDREQHHPYETHRLKLHSDGTPVSLHFALVCDDVCKERGYYRGDGVSGNPELSVTVKDWTAGAGDVTPVACVDSSVADLSEHPEVMRAVAAFDVLMGQLAGSSGLNVPSLTPLLEQQMFLADSAKQERAQPQSWTVALFAGVAGMAGGAAVLALDKVFNRRQQTPLLSEA